MSDTQPDVIGSTKDAQDESKTANASISVEGLTQDVMRRRQRISDLFTILCAGAALISDGYQNNLMTMSNVLFKKEYPEQYTSSVSTRVSNALLVGEIPHVRLSWTKDSHCANHNVHCRWQYPSHSSTQHDHR